MMNVLLVGVIAIAIIILIAVIDVLGLWLKGVNLIIFPGLKIIVSK